MHVSILKCIEFAQGHWFLRGQDCIDLSLKEELTPVANVVVADGAEDESREAARVSSAAIEGAKFISCSVGFRMREGVSWYA